MRRRATGARGLLQLAVVLVLASQHGGCSAEARELRTYELEDEALARAGMTPGGQWESAPFNDSPWIALPATSTIRVAHALGRSPALILPYLSFTADAPGAAREASLGAGNVANLSDINDTHITIENRTQADFYLRLVLQ